MFISAILATLSPLAAPPEWYRVAGSKQTVVYVTRLSTLDGDSRMVTVATVHATPMADNTAITLVKQSFRCSKRDTSDMRVSRLDSAGKVIDSKDLPLTEPYRPIAAKSDLDAAISFICDGKGGTRVDDPRADAQALFAGL